MATLRQIRELADAGCEIVRIAVPDRKAAAALPDIVPHSPVPLIADIHFEHTLALKALDAGIHGLRLNPGNIRKPEDVREVVAQGQGAPGPDPHRRQLRLRRADARSVRRRDGRAGRHARSSCAPSGWCAPRSATSRSSKTSTSA